MAREDWKSTEWSEESFDYGCQSALAFSVVDAEGNTLLSHAVSWNARHTLEPAEYGPDEKVYVTSPSDLPMREKEQWEGSSDGTWHVEILADDDGFYWVRHGQLVKPAVYSTEPNTEAIRRAEEKLESLLRYIRLAGRRLDGRE